MTDKKEKTPRQPMPEQPAEVRRRNFEEVPLGYSDETAKLEAGRCIQCKTPGCRQGCPVGIDIPGFIKAVADGDLSAGIRKLKEQNALPAVCGRVCPQESQCESQCILGKKGDPVAIGRLERYLADWERKQPTTDIPEPAPSTGKKVAVVGSGPSGLTVAGALTLKGHKVTVFEAFHKPGGVLLYGIPEFRLPKEILFYEINILKQMGVEFVLNAVVGKLVSLQELFEQGYDAIYVAVGAGLPYFLGVPGENLIGVYSANEYLTRSNLMKAYLFPKYDTPLVMGKNVVVVGGGNVAMDSARTAMRMGADSVSIVYRRSLQEMPARAEEVHHAQEEGIDFKILTNPVSFNGDKDGRLVSVTCVQMELGEPDASGRRRPVVKPGSEFTMPTDMAVISVGAGANPLLTSTTPELSLNKRGYIMADTETGKTYMRGVWAGGDIVTGMATVIEAMGAGKKAAKSMHDFLTLGW